MSTGTSPIFSFASTPALLPQLAKQAKHGLEQEPRSFVDLQELAKYFELPPYNFAETHTLALKILNDQVFQDHHGALQRLKPLAQKCIWQLEPVEAALDEETSILEPFVRELCVAHGALRQQYIAEYERLHPYEPYTILKNYPVTIRTYLTAFCSHLGALSPEKYAEWQQAASTSDEKLIPIFSRLAVYQCLENPILKPELFKLPDEYRDLYKAFTHAEKTDLASVLREENEPKTQKVKDLAQKISTFAYQIQSQSLNGVLALTYKGATQGFTLLDQMQPSENPRSVNLQCRYALVAFLKQESIDNEALPLFFEKQDAQKAVKAFGEYQALAAAERTEFEEQFLSETDDSDTAKIYNLLQDCRDIGWDLQHFPVPMLAKIAWQRRYTQTT